MAEKGPQQRLYMYIFYGYLKLHTLECRLKESLRGICYLQGCDMKPLSGSFLRMTVKGLCVTLKWYAMHNCKCSTLKTSLTCTILNMDRQFPLSDIFISVQEQIPYL